jgi:hypothetical protein
MNWGILALLAVIVSVLAAIAVFFIFLARRASRLSAAEAGTGADSALSGPRAAPPRPHGRPVAARLASTCSRFTRQWGGRPAAYGRRAGLRLWVLVVLPRRRGRPGFGLDDPRHRRRSC